MILAPLWQQFDQDAWSWIQAVEKADAARLEHGVRKSMDTLVRGMKVNSIWSTISVLNVMCGPRTLAGTLVNAKTPATSVTNVNFVSGDYNRSLGLLGDGTTKYLNTGINCNSVGQNDCALWVNIVSEATGTNDYYCGAGNGNVGGTAIRHGAASTPTHASRSLTGNQQTSGELGPLTGQTRTVSTGFSTRGNSTDEAQTRTSATPYPWNIFVFATNVGDTAALHANCRLGMFCFGAAHTLSTAESLVVSYKNAVYLELNLQRTAITDTDSIAWIEAVETADGQTLEQDVRYAMNQLVLDLKANSLWTPIQTMNVHMAARTLAGSLIDVKTPSASWANTNFVSGDYNRTTGLLGDGATKYLDTGRANNADGQNDQAMWQMVTADHTNLGLGRTYIAAGGSNAGTTSLLQSGGVIGNLIARCRNTTSDAIVGASTEGLIGVSRSASTGYTAIGNGAESSLTRTSQTSSTDSICVFCSNTAGVKAYYGNQRASVSAVGSAHSLTTVETVLDSFTALITAMGL